MSKLIVLANRSVIRLSGEDRRDFLQGVVTQDMERLTPGGAIFAALLTPQGKILFDFLIADTGEEFLIDCDKNAAEALAKRLTLYKLRAKIAIEIDDALRVAVSQTEIANGLAYQDPRLEALGWRAIGDAAAPDATDYDARRIALGVPQFGSDFGSDDMFLLDVNYDALNGVSYGKGCFVGQEVSSRMKRKSEARRRTLIAAFDGPAPAKGAAVTAGESTLGEILAAAGDRALALIRLDRWEKAQKAGAAPACDGRALQLIVPDYLKQD